jgi:hypothetical protein
MAKKRKRPSEKPSKPAVGKKKATGSSGDQNTKGRLEALRKKFLPSKSARTPADKSKGVSDSTPASKSAHEVIAEQMPGMRIVSSAPVRGDRDALAHATSHGVGLDALQQHFCGASQNASVSDLPAESEVVMVEPVTADAMKRGPGPKAVIVSGGRIIGRQG